MIEQALSIATSDGGTTQATVQFPSTYTLDGNQHLQVGNQNVSIDKDGQIIVHSVGLPGEFYFCNNLPLSIYFLILRF